jgi:hypothetical protein
MSLLQDNNQSIDETRREFLRKSIYAAYATPVIVTLLVSKASAGVSSSIARKNCLSQQPPGIWESSTKTCYPAP